MNYKIVAQRICKIKKEKGIYYSYLQNVVGISNYRLLNLLKGKSAPRLSEFALLCIALGVSADELLKTDEEWEIIER